MIAVRHPPGTRILLDVRLPAEGRQVVLHAAFEDSAVRPLGSGMEIRVTVDGGVKGATTIRHPNTVGRYFWGPIPVVGRELALEIEPGFESGGVVGIDLEVFD